MTAQFVAYAAHQFELNAKQEDGSTLRDHLLLVAKRKGELPDKLRDEPEMPEAMAPLWDDFLDLHLTRGATATGSAAITYEQIDAWQRVTRSSLEPWQVAAIRAADHEFFATQGAAGG